MRQRLACMGYVRTASGIRCVCIVSLSLLTPVDQSEVIDDELTARTDHPECYGADHSVNATIPYEGTYYLTASGTVDKPIAIGSGSRVR
jgi:hypothetical protein